jgi:hypothetical protein
MKKIVLLSTVAFTFLLGACQKDKTGKQDVIPSDLPRTEVPTALQGSWMYGNFSMTEYWNQNPGSYVGNALEYAIAFQFFADGTYTQYFTSSYVLAGVRTYQQSVTRGTIEVDAVNNSIVTHPYKAHYKRTRNSQVEEERDMLRSELSGASYHFATGTEPNNVKAIYLTLAGTTNALTFLQKP